jgi:hypothetical protein
VIFPTRPSRLAFFVVTALLVGACDGGPEASPVQPVTPTRTVVVSVRSVFPGETPCGTTVLAGVSAIACAGDSLVVEHVSGLAELQVTGPSVERYVDQVEAGRATAWLLERRHEEALNYVEEIVNVSGSRPFPFGFAASQALVDLAGLEPLQAAAARDVVPRLDTALAPLVGRSYFQLVGEPAPQGIRAVTTQVAGGTARTFAETFDAGHKIVCRIELDGDLPAGAGMSSRIAHEVGHCLGLARHDPEDRPDRIMNRLAPGEYWTTSHGLNEFDAEVFALAVLASQSEIHLTNFR